MKTVSQALIELLEHYGVDTVFGIPGVHTLELYRALGASRIRHVTPRHEQGAAFMADGYARRSGKPGVCLLISGPGLTNAITGIAQAMQDSIPMLVISGVNPQDQRRQGVLHELPDQHGLMQVLTGNSQSITNPDDTPGVIEQAFRAFATQRPGPAHIEIPLDLMAAPIRDFELPPTDFTPPSPGADHVSTAASLIDDAARPVILAGGGSNGAERAVVSLARRIGAPIISTINGRAGIGQGPLHVAASPSLRPVREAIAQADLVMGIGTEFGQTDYDIYLDGGFPMPQKLVRIDLDGRNLHHPYRADAALHGAAAQVVPALEQALTRPPRAEAEAWAVTIMSEVERALQPARTADFDLLDTIYETLPGCLVVGDSTRLVYSGNFLHRSAIPKAWFNSATGFGTLGYGPSAAIGAALAEPGAPVVCLVGDGGIQFSLAELGTAMDTGSPVIFLVWNNHGYGQIELSMTGAGIPPIGVNPSAPRFDHLAAAYGLSFAQVNGALPLQSALSAADGLGRAALIEIVASDD